MTNNFEKKLEEINSRLRAARLRVSVFRRQNKLWLRATLPPKPYIKKKNNYQQAISINANATIAGLRYAEQKAKQLAVDLDSRKFDWKSWIEIKSTNDASIKTIGQWIEEYHEHRDSVSKISSATKKIDYLAPSRKLPHQEILTVEVLIRTIKEKTIPDTRTRRRLVNYCSRLGEFAQLPTKEIKKLIGNYSNTSVNPRALPSDADIEKFILNIKNPGWRWTIGIIATYGLRSHEAFYTDLSQFPKIRILEGKTGSRSVLPLYPEWAHNWGLENKILPPHKKQIDNFEHEQLTAKVSAWMRNHKPGFKTLDLRHCYARRCFEFGFDPTQSAKLMGHSWQVHLQTYRAWFDEEVYDKAYKNIISNPNRPLPPIADE